MMITKHCRDTRREIDEMELGHRPSADATAHLSVCVACRTFQTERTSLRELVGSLEPVVAPPDFDMRLRARIAAEKYDNRRQPFFARLISTPALAAAALFVIVAGSVFWISRRPVTPVVTPNNSPIAKNNPEATTPAAVNRRVDQEPTVPANEGTDIAVDYPSKALHRPTRARAPRSEDYNVGSAPVIGQTDADQAYVPSRPVEFALQDESGKTRRISLPPVSFGAQNLAGNNRTNISYSPSSRVW